MSEAAIYEFGSRVYCSDADCGELLQVVVEPEMPRLLQLVVCSVADGAARLVDPALARATRYGVLLDCAKSVFDGFPAMPAHGATRPATAQSLPDPQTRIRRGDHVRALDGDAGRVLGLIVRPEDEAITHVLLAVGHLWHRRHAAVPVDYVAGLGFAGLDILLTKSQVADFAAPAMRQ
jgi:hypothetical protein